MKCMNMSRRKGGGGGEGGGVKKTREVIATVLMDEYRKE